MSEDFDAASAVATALGEAPPEGTEGEPSGTSGGTGDPRAGGTDQPADAGDLEDATPESPVAKLRERLLATEPNPPLESDDLSTWDTEYGGLRRFKRGLYKFVGVEGATALEDMALGLIEEVGGDEVALAASTAEETDTESDANVGALADEGALA